MAATGRHICAWVCVCVPLGGPRPGFVTWQEEDALVQPCPAPARGGRAGAEKGAGTRAAASQDARTAPPTRVGDPSEYTTATAPLPPHATQLSEVFPFREEYGPGHKVYKTCFQFKDISCPHDNAWCI